MAPKMDKELKQDDENVKKDDAPMKKRPTPMKAMKAMKKAMKEDDTDVPPMKAMKAMKVMKKPSAAKETLHDKVKKWQQLPEEDFDDTRDKGKGQKFAKMFESLPDYVKTMYNEEAKKSGSCRAYRTRLVNSLFVRQPDGSLTTNLSAPMFEEYRRVWEKRYGRDERKACVFLA